MSPKGALRQTATEDRHWPGQDSWMIIGALAILAGVGSICGAGAGRRQAFSS